MKHTLTFQSEKIGLSIACKKSTLYLCTNKENNVLKREDNRNHVNPLLYRGLFPFNTCFAGKHGIFSAKVGSLSRKAPRFLAQVAHRARSPRRFRRSAPRSVLENQQLAPDGSQKNRIFAA